MYSKPQIHLHGLESHGASSRRHHKAGWYTDDSKEPFLGKQRREACCLDTPDREAVVRAAHGKERFTMGPSDREVRATEDQHCGLPSAAGTSRVPRWNNSLLQPPTWSRLPAPAPPSSRLRPHLPVNQSSELPLGPHILPPSSASSPASPPPVPAALLWLEPPRLAMNGPQALLVRMGTCDASRGQRTLLPPTSQVACPRCPRLRLDPSPASRAWGATPAAYAHPLLPGCGDRQEALAVEESPQYTPRGSEGRSTSHEGHLGMGVLP